MTDHRKLGRQDADYDNMLAEYAEYTPAPPVTKQLSLLFVGACIILPCGLFVLAAALINNYLKEKAWQSPTRLR